MISRSAKYAIGAMVYLANANGTNANGKGWALSRDISTGARLPRQYLSKILRTLASRGLLESRRGRSGGFRLARTAADITLFEVVDPLDHLDTRGTCLLRPAGCDDSTPCGLHNSYRHIHDNFIELLHRTTLADAVTYLKLPGPRRVEILQ